MRILLLHNASAGTACDDASELIDRIKRAGHTVEYCASRDEWQTGFARKPEVVAVVGGDGTVGQVARIMPDPSVPIALLPMGTANNIATGLGLTEIPVEELVAGWAHARRRPFDVGVAKGPWGTFRFLESVGAGLLAEAIATIDEGWASHVNGIRDQEERIAAAVQVVRHTLLELEPAHFELRLDGIDLTGEYLLVEAMNFGAAGPNLQLSPEASNADGLLDVVLVERDTRHLLHRELETYRSEPDLAPALSVHRGRRLVLQAGPCAVHMDDELWIADSPLTIETWIEPAALTFLTTP